MTTTHSSPLVEGPYASYDLPMTSTDLMISSNGELQDFTNKLVDRATAYGVEIGT